MLNNNKIASTQLVAGGKMATRLSGIVDESSNKSSREKVRALRSSSTLARLNTADLRLHGRENDMNMLLGKLRNMDNLKDELTMVAGSSGCGKTSLVMKGLRDPAKKMGIAFCGGKFDLNNNALPYSAFADALSALAEHVVASKNSSLIKSDINKALGGEDMQLFGQVCQDVFSLRLEDNESDLFSLRLADNESNSPIKLGDGKKAVSRMQYAIRRLMKVICSHVRVVMFIDDLQWADDASLDLLLSLQKDDEIGPLLLVGAYRDDDVLDGHPLTIRLREAEKFGSSITTIKLRNLECKTMQSLVAEALRVEDNEDAVESLAAIIHKKTYGNPFFVLTFLTSIYEEELLEYNFGNMRWVWDDEAIKQKFATDNVTSMMVSKLKRLKLAAQNIVKVASCLGASFSIKLLAIIVEESSTKNDSQKEFPINLTFTEADMDESSFDIDNVVEDFQEKGLWERETDDVCWFVHDQIQSAALELIPKEEQTRLKGIIGGILLKKLDEAMIDESIFVIVSLRNHAGPSLNEVERFDLVKLNFRAGIKASKNAAFDTAAVYFQAARELLGSQGWVIDPELTIRLYSAEAHARFVIGELEIMESLVGEILSKDIPVEDKFQVYETKILEAMSGNRFDEALSTALYVRKQLGFNPIPTRVTKIKIIIEYMKTNRALKGLTTEDIIALPDLTDERIIMGQRIMELLLTVSFQTVPNLFPIISFRMVRESIKSGINRSSCDAFSTFGVLLCGGVGDLARGGQMGEIASLLLDKPGMRPMESRTICNVENGVNHWTVPLQRSLPSSLKGYQAGLASGDIQQAAYNIMLRSFSLWYCSRPLDDVLYEMNVNKDVCAMLREERARLGILPYLQAVINLQGVSSKPWKLSGEEMIFEELHELCIKTKNHVLLAYLILTQLELFVIFQDWVSAKRLLMKAVDLRPALIASFQSVRYTFLEGLICLKAAQASSSWMEKRKLKTKAKKSLKMLHGWLKKGNINVVHTVHLLTAEHAVLNGQHIQQAEGSYKAALTSATRSGFLHDKALTHELAGNYYMDKGDDYWAKYHLNLAHTTYLDWKATAKAADLARKYPQFIKDDIPNQRIRHSEILKKKTMHFQ